MTHGKSGSRYWNHSSPMISAGDVFNLEYQTDKQEVTGWHGKRKYNLNVIKKLATLYRIYAEYFDNEGISFNVALDTVPN